MKKPASLGAGLIAKKGQAAPMTTAPAAPLERVRASYYKALTVKLDRPRYEALKRAGIALDKSSQLLLVEALDHYLATLDETAGRNP